MKWLRSLAAAVVVGACATASVAVAAGPGQAPAPRSAPVAQVPAPAPAPAKAGSASACLYAAQIAPPAWNGRKLDPAVAKRLGAQFLRLTDDCLAAGNGGPARTACLQAAQTLGEYRNRTRSIAELDAKYNALWRDCISG